MAVVRSEAAAPTHRVRATPGPVAVITALCALLYANWIVAVARFQANVPFLDQWDFLYPFFYGGTSWDRFWVQHGPVREGVGLVVTGWIFDATSLDVRYDSVWIATALLAATLLALRLKWKMTGTIGLLDAWIPVLCLSLGQYETVLTVPQVSHSVLPFALTLLAANVWFSPRPAARYVAAGAIGFALTFTGFGILISPVIAVLLAVRTMRHVVAREYWPAAFAAAGLAIIVESGIMFRTNYTFLPAVEGFRFPWTPMMDYVRFVAIMVNLPIANTGEGTRHYLIGSVLLVAVACTVVRVAWLWLTRPASANIDVLVLVMASGVLFVASTAIGRVPLGLLAGTAPRYFTLLLLLWLGIYLTAATWSRWILPIGALCVWLLAAWPYAAMPSRPLRDWPGTVGLVDSQFGTVLLYGKSKVDWARTYLATGSIDTAQASAQQPVYPDPELTRLDTKLRVLRERRLSFFAGHPDRGDYLPWLADSRITCPASGSSPRACR